MACNPLAPQHVSGGVGGGCASAVGSGTVEVAVGTDHLAGVRVRPFPSPHHPSFLGGYTGASSPLIPHSLLHDIVFAHFCNLVTPLSSPFDTILMCLSDLCGEPTVHHFVAVMRHISIL